MVLTTKYPYLYILNSFLVKKNYTFLNDAPGFNFLSKGRINCQLKTVSFKKSIFPKWAWPLQWKPDITDLYNLYNEEPRYNKTLL